MSKPTIFSNPKRQFQKLVTEFMLHKRIIQDATWQCVRK